MVVLPISFVFLSGPVFGFVSHLNALQHKEGSSFPLVA